MSRSLDTLALVALLAALVGPTLGGCAEDSSGTVVRYHRNNTGANNEPTNNGTNNATNNGDTNNSTNNGGTNNGATNNANNGEGACLRSADCEGGRVCVVHRDEASPLSCGDPVGDGTPGGPCVTDADCDHGLCLDGQCSAPCVGDDDCVSGQHCATTALSDTVSADVCVADADTSCASDDDCGGGEVCRAERGDGALETSCGATDTGDRATGVPCAADDECASNLCEGGICSAPCDDDDDCAGPVDGTCELREVMTQGAPVQASVCVPPASCSRFADCTDEACVFVRGDDSLPAFCDAGNTTPGDRTGELCASDAECLANLCLNGQCAEPCTADTDCGDGQACQTRIVTLTGGNASVQVCVLPPEDPCTSDDDCIAPEVCVARRRGDRIDFVCGDPNDGGGGDGDACTVDAGCERNLCLADGCAGPCRDSADCGAGTVCSIERVPLDEGTASVQVCGPAEPCLAPRQCDAAETCYVRDLDGGQWDTVCLPPNAGGGDPGADCDAHADCASNLCLTEWVTTACSAPCEVDTDCTDGWRCRQRPVRDGNTSEAFVCIPPNPPSCTTDADCTDPQICAVVPNRSGNGRSRVCIDPIGGGDPGDGCTTDADCQSGLCLDGTCTTPCSNSMDCPNPLVCQSQVVDGTTLDLCVLDTPDPCQVPTDCTDPALCRAQRIPDALSFTCGRADDADDRETGDLCDDDDQCASNLCEAGLCTNPCANDAHCAAAGLLPTTCQDRQVDTGNGTIDLRLCTGPDACSRFADCNGGACAFVKTPDDVLSFCGDGNPTPGDRAGDLCTTDDECLANLCLNGQCAEPCTADADCSTGLTCARRIVTVDSGNIPVDVCVVPPADPCQRDADCVGGEICVARRLSDRVDFVCGDPNAGGGQTGDGCAADANCLANLCLDGACHEPCATGTDCDGGRGEVCGTEAATVDRGMVDLSVCTFPEPCTAPSQCGATETCYVRDTPTGGIDLACLAPNPGGRPLGQSCSQDSQCAANLCLTDWLTTACSTPCDTDADCNAAAGWTCRTRQLGLAPDSTASVCVPPAPVACDSNRACPMGQVCGVVPDRSGTGLTSVCIAPVGNRDYRAGCTTDAECRTGLCLDNLCTTLCADVDLDCGAQRLCSPNPVTRGPLTGSFALCQDYPEIACRATRECPSGDRVCGEIRGFEDPTTTYCIFPEPTGAPIGTACDGTRSPSSQCEDRICLTPFTDECTTTCIDASDCAAAGAPDGFTCTDFRISGDTVRLCALDCLHDTTCTRDDHLCALSRNVTDNQYQFICRTAMGTDPVGTDCSTTINCDHGICLIRRDANGNPIEQVCTAPCTTDADCPVDPVNPWVCGDAEIIRPAAEAPYTDEDRQTLNVCTRN